MLTKIPQDIIMCRKDTKGGNCMSIKIQEKETKKAMVTMIVKKFVQLSPEEKSFIAGYMAAKQEGKTRHE